MSSERHQQVMELFDEALERPFAERSAWLDQRCQANGELRQAVEKMLVAHEKCTPAFLEASAWEIEARQLAAADQPLQPGETLAQFTVLSPLGAGAMGDVYLARDTRLDRKVALKVLPTRFTWDASRLRRFEREARSASALNHQNIITIYDFGQAETDSGTRHFIAAEYVEGITLRTRLQDGALPIAEALDIAQQIAAALEAAHAAGIIHRDIKPENVMLRPDGVVKVLDFGIAKLTETKEPDAAALHRSTEQGTVIGTPGYMSPEQVRGQDVDTRTDIFSLGVVLYEMIAGQLPFRGATHADVMVALLERKLTPLGVLVPTVSSALDSLVTQMLKKERQERYAASSELPDTLKQCRLADSTRLRFWPKIKARFNPPSAKYIRAAAWLGAAIALTVIFLYWKNRSQGTLNQYLQSEWRQTSLQFSEKIGGASAISRIHFSPDGRLIVYSFLNDNVSDIWIKEIATGKTKKIFDQAGESFHPIWSPDGMNVAYASTKAGKLGIWAALATGGEPKLLWPVNQKVDLLVRWIKYETGGKIYFESSYNLYALDLNNGKVQPIKLFDKPSSHEFSISPDGEWCAYVESLQGQRHVWVSSLTKEATQQITFGEGSDASPIWFPDSKTLAFSSVRSNLRQTYVVELTTHRIKQITFGNDEFTPAAVKPDGSAIVGTLDRQFANLYSANLITGLEEEQSSDFGLQLFPDLAPESGQIAYCTPLPIRISSGDLFVKTALSAARPVKITSAALNPKWAPNGKEIAFLRATKGKYQIWKINPATQQEQMLSEEGVQLRGWTQVPYNLVASAYNWSPNSQQIAYVGLVEEKNGFKQERINIIESSDGQSRIIPSMRAMPGSLSCPTWSPNGAILAYLNSVKSGQPNFPLTEVIIYEDENERVIYQDKLELRILGWDSKAESLYLVRGSVNGRYNAPQPVQLLRLARTTGESYTIATLPNTYLLSLSLAKNRLHTAYVTRDEGHDQLRVVDLRTGRSRVIPTASDPGSYYSSLTWAPKGNQLFYSKQRSWVEINLLEINR